MLLGNGSRLLRARIAFIAGTLVAVTLIGAGPVRAATGIDIQLPIGRAIGGVVTAGGGAVANVNLDACPPAMPYGGPACVGTQTDAVGRFRLGGIAAASWLVRVTPPEFADDNGFMPDVSGGFYSAGTVTPSPAGAEQVSTIIADQNLAIDLPPGGHIAGFIQSPSGPVANVTVAACVASTLDCYPGTTDGAGGYDIGALEDGDYLVQVEAPMGADLQSGWVASGGIVINDEAADAYVVVGGATTPADVTLPPGRHLSGRITGPGGPLDGADVSACLMPDGYPCYSASTTSDGTYTIAGLSRLSYFVRVIDPSGVLPPVFYRSDGSSGNYREGTPVDLATGHATGIDVDVPAGAMLSGTVTLPGGGPAEFVGVQACLGSCNDAYFSSETDITGAYSIGPLPPGGYIVNASVSGDVLGGYSTSSGLVELEANAEAFPVVAGAAVTLDVALQEAGAIGGSVQASDGAPITGDISACRGDSCQYGRVDGGSFQLQGVRPGSYVVRLEPDFGSGYLKGYHSAGGLVRTVANATSIVMAGAEDESIAIVVPAEAGSIAGTVTAAGSGPIADARVVACAAEDDCSVADTAPDGSYVVGGLWPDEYLVSVFASGDFLTGWYASDGTVTDASLASLVAVGDTGAESGNRSTHSVLFAFPR